MRKRVVRGPQIAAAWDQGWLDLDKLASVEVSSEDENHPIESGLLGDEKRGWRAAEFGSQTIRLIFDNPQRLKRIFLAFEDSEVHRTQEFVLRWSSRLGEPSGKSCASSGILARPEEAVRSRTMLLTYRMSEFSNCSLCRTRVAARPSRHSPRCVYLDIVGRQFTAWAPIYYVAGGIIQSSDHSY